MSLQKRVSGAEFRHNLVLGHHRSKSMAARCQIGCGAPLIKLLEAGTSPAYKARDLAYRTESTRSF